MKQMIVSLLDVALICMAVYYSIKAEYDKACWFLLLSQLPFQNFRGKTL